MAAHCRETAKATLGTGCQALVLPVVATSCGCKGAAACLNDVFGDVERSAA
jgi:hypothetical protein